MTVSSQHDVTDRGAASGPPVAIADDAVTGGEPRELRFGPLPAPGLIERLRASWSLQALIPSFDRDPVTGRRRFRLAGAVALVLHVVMVAGIVVIGRYAAVTFIDKPKVVWIGPDEYRPHDSSPDTAGADTTPSDRNGPASGESGGGGGSNTDSSPVTAGEPPKMAPTPSHVPLNLPPPVAPVSLPVTPTALGPDISVPVPTGPTGLPDAPDAPGDPSLGQGGGSGVGNGSGDGAGGGSGPGSGGGPGGGTGPGGNGPGGTRPTGAPGAGGTGVTGPAGPGGAIRDRNVRLVVKAKPRIPQKMVETQTFGTVTISVTIGPDGSILSFVPINSLPNGGTQAAIDALRRCRFEPAIRNGVAVTDTTTIRFDIRPN